MIKELKIFVKKVKHIPKNKLPERMFLGIKKYIQDSPYSISIQTVSACNLKCKHCFINDYQTHIHDGITKIMKFEEFVIFAERLRPMLKKVSYVNFSTFEAIMNKNLFNMMDVILDINPKIQFPFLSNTMLITQQKIDQLCKYPISNVSISLDGYTKKTVEDFKTEVSFEQIIDTIKLFRKSALKDKISVGFVAHQNNIGELAEYVNFVNGLGVKHILVSNLLTFTTSLVGQELYSKEGNKYAEEQFALAAANARRNGQIIELPRLTPELLGCQAVESFFIDINGNVAPCDFLGVTTPFTLWGETIQNPPILFGNILKDDPIEIYRKEAFKRFRKKHQLGNELPAECTHCIDGYGLMCSNRIVHE
jgi:sulfatase maturation enzyme AslB (radical SAM superfamily)